MIGGVVQHVGGDPRFWRVDGERRLRWWGSAGADGAALPVPGTERVLCCDPFSKVMALLADGELWRYEQRAGNPPRWRRTVSNIMGEDPMARNQRSVTPPGSEPRLVAGFVERRGSTRCIVAVDVSRRVLVLGEDAKPSVVGPGPIPGAERVLCVKVDAAGSTALLADGTLLLGTLRGWSRLGSMTPEPEGADSPMRLVALKSFKLTGSLVVAKGETFEASHARGHELIANGRAAPADSEDDAA